MRFALAGLADDTVERVSGDRSNRSGGRVNERHDLEPEFLARVEKPCVRVVRVSVLPNKVVTPRDAGLLELIV